MKQQAAAGLDLKLQEMAQRIRDLREDSDQTQKRPPRAASSSPAPQRKSPLWPKSSAWAPAEPWTARKSP